MWRVKNFFAILISVFVAITVLLTYPADIKGKLSNKILKLWTNIILLIFGVKVITEGTENITNGRGKIYISNHCSYLDIFILLAKVPDNFRMIYKKEINRIPPLGWAMLAAKFIPIDRKNVRSSLKSLDKATERIKNGISVLIFPEGTRSKNGSVGEFKRGMFMIAQKSDAELIPVSLSNSGKLMPIGSLRIKPGTVKLVIDKPVKYSEDRFFLDNLRQKIISNIKSI